MVTKLTVAMHTLVCKSGNKVRSTEIHISYLYIVYIIPTPKFMKGKLIVGSLHTV